MEDKDEIILSSRYKNVLSKLLLDRPSTYKLISKGMYIRYQINSSGDSLEWVDLEGGPMLRVGGLVSGREIEKIVKDSNDIFIIFKQ